MMTKLGARRAAGISRISRHVGGDLEIIHHESAVPRRVGDDSGFTEDDLANASQDDLDQLLNQGQISQDQYDQAIADNANGPDTNTDNTNTDNTDNSDTSTDNTDNTDNSDSTDGSDSSSGFFSGIGSAFGAAAKVIEAAGGGKTITDIAKIASSSGGGQQQRTQQGQQQRTQQVSSPPVHPNAPIQAKAGAVVGDLAHRVPHSPLTYLGAAGTVAIQVFAPKMKPIVKVAPLLAAGAIELYESLTQKLTKPKRPANGRRNVGRRPPAPRIVDRIKHRLR